MHFGPKGVRQVNAPQRIGRAAYIPWTDVKPVRLTRVRGDFWRVTVRRAVPWWKPEIPPVDAEVRLSDAGLEDFRGRVEAFRAQR